MEDEELKKYLDENREKVLAYYRSQLPESMLTEKGMLFSLIMKKGDCSGGIIKCSICVIKDRCDLTTGEWQNKGEGVGDNRFEVAVDIFCEEYGSGELMDMLL